MTILPQDVADAFVKQYYNILQESPQDTHRFYSDKSILSHPCSDGLIKSATTLKEWNPNLSTVHAQDSVMGSLIVGVTGYLTHNDNVTKHFAHTFCLAPQEGGGFYVHNDFLQFIEIKVITSSSPSVDDEASATASPPIDKEHPWIREDREASDKPIDSAVLSRMKQFRAINKLKKLALKVIGENLPAE